MSRTLMFWLAMLLVFTGAATSWFGFQRLQKRSLHGSVTVKDNTAVREDVDELTEFAFTDQLGNTFASSDLQGKVWIGSFFFADCPGICMVQNNEIAKLHRRFIDQGLKVVSISVTPDKDPPHKLRQYGDRFNADDEHWKFLTGRDTDYVRQVGDEIFSLAAADESHTAHVVVFDRSGQHRGAYKVTDSIDYAKLVQKIDELLAASPADDALTESHPSKPSAAKGSESDESASDEPENGSGESTSAADSTSPP